MKKNHFIKISILFLFAFSIGLVACGGGKKSGNGKSVKCDRAGINEVIIREVADADKINPFTYTSGYSVYPVNDIYLSLLGQNPKTLELIPILAVSRPTKTLIEDGPYKGGISFVYEIRPEAKWDNNSPVLATDVAFTLKALKNPLCESETFRPFYEFIDDIILDPANPRKFTFMCKGRYMLSEEVSGMIVMPEYVYDPSKIMAKFTVKELNDPANSDKLKGNMDLKKFADDFNGDFHSRDPKGVSGCGPYMLDKYETGQRIVLKKKENWWGDAFAGKVMGFNAFPKKITFEIIQDDAGALSSLRGEKIDILKSIKAKDFLDLEKSEQDTAKYKLFKEEQLAYLYIAMNMRNDKLSDLKVRQALAYLTDVEQIIKNLQYGMAARQVCIISPLKRYFNASLKPIPFDVEKAKGLLEAAGWKDSDGNGIRDKVINGKKEELNFTIKYGSGGGIGDQVAAILQEAFRKAGCELSTSPKEFTVLIQEVKKHNFELYMGSWGGVTGLEDPNQIWHTRSYTDGDNFTGFGDQKSDALIEAIRNEQDDAKRDQMYKDLQQMIYDAQPYIFISSAKNRFAIHKRFADPLTTLIRPGFVEMELKMDANFGK
jgi:peptide/nickel transport system substrate-binding protein